MVALKLEAPQSVFQSCPGELQMIDLNGVKTHQDPAPDIKHPPPR